MVETAVPRITEDVPADRSVDLSRAHFIGIGGNGMLPVARVCAERGFTVSGSDNRTSERLKELARLGASVHTGHAAEHVPEDATAVVFTHAVAQNNSEILRARRLGIPVMHRSTALNSLMATHTAPIAVMGTHGKSSTSGMLAFALARMGQSPSYAIGADLGTPGSGGHASGANGVFVAEVDESDRTHIGMAMRVAVITNIGYDHPENYSEEGDHVNAYEECVRAGLHEDGTLVLDADSSGARELAARLALAGDGPRVVTFGRASSADWRLVDVASDGGRSTAVLRGPGGQEFDLVLLVPGAHQLHNAAAVIATLDALGQDCDQGVQQLLCFDGVQRRMTQAGEAAGVRAYDSYAHHPDEVSADLAAARSLVGPGGRVITVFQPSCQSRLDTFDAGFAKALAGCDEVVLTDSVRGVTPAALRILAARINQAGGSARHQVPDRAEAAGRAAQMARPGDVVLLMGPGDIVGSGQILRAALGELVSVAA
ncbi:UDP-N-acetylmuramate--L-alanine ligase [Streptomyces phaeofaciens JCM 4814]|uniref:UDP-N-acetylmuramate--L-alanine ligase n=1 Tax=Streptomyces phaeofaciens TaxID=68254 RepID=A0A918HBX0_9ACTN|nr:Mur ligase domain-containing protein [Streptomyces phaeofaciens]GGT51744.1 UDP-N-acetylmuramate--L-alanine ligase [Streptomyces phaeofaciens]